DGAGLVVDGDLLGEFRHGCLLVWLVPGRWLRVWVRALDGAVGWVSAGGYDRELGGPRSRCGHEIRLKRAASNRDGARSRRSLAQRSDSAGHVDGCFLRRMWAITSSGEYTPLPGCGPNRVTC